MYVLKNGDSPSISRRGYQMRKVVGAVAVLSTLLAMGCATMKAPILPNGQKINLFMLVNRGDQNAMQEKQWKYRNEVGEYMENDLIGRLTAAGYNVRQIQNRNEFTAGEGNYLLSIAITSYNPGSKAARMLVGSFVGMCSLTTRYELIGTDAAVLTSSDTSSRSGSDWRDCVRKNDSVTMKAVTIRLKAVYPAAPGQ
jgi:hypothetical protein